MWDLLLKNGIVITIDKERRIYDKGYVAVEGDSIVAVGPMEQLPPQAQAARIVDCEGHAVLPGLVDGHGHGGHCLTRTLGEHLDDDWEPMAEEIYYRCTDWEFWRAEGALAAAERLKFGSTTGVSMVGSTPRVDSLQPVEANLEGSLSTGIRQLSGVGCPYGAFPKRARVWREDGSAEDILVEPETAYQTTEQAVKRLNDRHPRGTCIVAPGRMGRRPDESDQANIRHNREMHRIASEYGVPLHTHAYGGDVQFLMDHTPEVLTPRLSLTHSTGYSRQELEILAKTGAFVFHGPTTHANIVGHCPVQEMLGLGINLAVVTDGTAPDRSYDLWRDMKNVQLFQRFRKKDGNLIPCGQALELVTIEPARALEMDHLIGSLEPGKRADIITINVNQPHLAPFGVMPVQRLVYHAMGQDVDMAIVDGVVAMENRRLTQIDEKKLLEDAARAFEKMTSRLNRPEVMENPNLWSSRPAGQRLG